jgi:hypothetical protein
MAEVNGPEYYTQLAKDMRAMADFIESKADTLPAPFFEGTKVSLDFWQRDKEGIVQAARSFGKADKNYTDFSFELVKKFGSGLSELKYWSSRSVVCERVQTGTKVEPVKVTTVHETGEMKETPIYEWKCDEPLLS